MVAISYLCGSNNLGDSEVLHENSRLGKVYDFVGGYLVIRCLRMELTVIWR